MSYLYKPYSSVALTHCQGAVWLTSYRLRHRWWRANGMALSRAAPMDREVIPAESRFQDRYDLARRKAASATAPGWAARAKCQSSTYDRLFLRLDDPSPLAPMGDAASCQSYTGQRDRMALCMVPWLALYQFASRVLPHHAETMILTTIAPTRTTLPS